MSERAGTVQKLTEARAAPRRSKMRPSTPMYLVGGAMLAAIFVVPLVWEILRSFEAVRGHRLAAVAEELL